MTSVSVSVTLPDPNPPGAVAGAGATTATDSETKSPSESQSDITKILDSIAPITAQQKELRDGKYMDQKKLLDLQTRDLKLILSNLTEESLVDMESDKYQQLRTKAHAKLLEIKQTLQDLEETLSKMFVVIVFGPGGYIKAQLHDLVKSIILLNYYEKGTLMSHEEVGHILGIPLSAQENGGKFNRIFLGLNTYLCGILHIDDELLKYAFIAAELDNYERVNAVQVFLKEVIVGFTTYLGGMKYIRKTVQYLQNHVLPEINNLIFQMKIRKDFKNLQETPGSQQTTHRTYQINSFKFNKFPSTKTS